MKKTNFTIHEGFTTRLTTLLVMLFISLTGISLNAQTDPCAIICNALTNVSLDQDGEANITVAMVADTSDCMDGMFTITIEELDGTPVDNPVTCEYLNHTLVVRVNDSESSNYAWGNLQIEDYLKPEIDCVVPAPGTINCFNIPSSANMLGATDNCTPTGELVLHILEEITVPNSDCINNPDLVKTVTRTFVTEDNSGNLSDECTIEFEVNTVVSTSSDLMVDIPPLQNYITLPFDCTNSQVPQGEIPPTSLTGGVPAYKGTPIYPPSANSCLMVTKEEIQISSAGPGHCADTYMRTWKIYEWACASTDPIRTIVQMIDVIDVEGPVIVDPVDDFLASTSNHECSGMVYMDPIEAIDECGETVKITITYPGGPVLEANGGWIELPVGVNEVTYKAYDQCDNLTTDVVLVTVEDITPPVSICNQFTAVGLTNDGFAHVAATVFDDGSYDECNLERMLVRRMNPNDECGECEAPVFSDFTSLGKFNGHYYYLSDKKLSGRLARKHAVALGGYGVSLESSAESNWLTAAMPEGLNYYIGLGNNGGSTYTWASGSNLTLDEWESGQPDDEDPYVIFKNDPTGWDDVDGSEEYRYVVEIAEDCWYSEYTAFCCDDIGAPGDANMVVFRVIDSACNFNECMVDVDVQDKIGPLVSAPNDVIVSCEVPLSESDLLAYGSDLEVYDNCGYTTDVAIDTTNLLCDVLYTITYTVTDDGDRTSTDSHTVLHDYSLDITADDFNESAIADKEYTDGCENPDPADYGVDVTGTLGFPAGACTQLAMNIESEVFYFGQEQSGTCFKILRTFRVINWCEINQTNSTTGAPGTNEVYTFTQTIKVSSDVAPTLACQDKLTFDSTDDSCESGVVTLTQSAIDNCEAGNAMTYSYSIDGGPVENGTGTEASVTRTYSIGDHEIEWTFTNACGNSRTCTQEFEVLSAVAPVPYCLSSITMTAESGSQVDIWASDFDLDTQHPCEGYTYKTSFSATDPTDDVRYFSCNDAGDQSLSVYYTSVDADGDYVTNSSGDLVQSFCDVTAVIQCNGNKPVVEGHISTPQADMLDDVRVDLISAETFYAMTEEGAYAFPEMPNGGDYIVDPIKTDDVSNGVSTLDLVLIQRHVIGLENLDGAYNLIAADINKDDMISAIDIVDLRKVILGVNDTFTNNDSWRFVDANYTFNDPTNPWTSEIPESYNINNLNQDMIIDFTAIKVGDVNNSVELPNAVSTSSEVRTNTSLSMVADMTQAQDGSIATIPVYTEEAISLAGAQMTINLGSDVAFAAIEAGAMDITDANIGLRYADRGFVTLSWDNTNGLSLNAGDVLFNIVVEAEQYDNSTMVVTSDITSAEAFNSNNEVMDVELSIRDNASEGFALMQNTPNPFNDFTVISFNLPKAMNATLTVYDVNGRTLTTISSNFDEGNNNIRLDKSELGASGVLYYQLQAGDFTANRKMVVFN